jgi:hypothetical protein
VVKFRPSALQALAILTVRCAYELTQLQAEEGRALYANADSVVLDGRSEPRYWRDCGIVYRLVARGKTDIHCLGAYRVGEKETIPYRYAAANNVVKGFKAERLERPVWHLRLIE